MVGFLRHDRELEVRGGPEGEGDGRGEGGRGRGASPQEWAKEWRGSFEGDADAKVVHGGGDFTIGRDRVSIHRRRGRGYLESVQPMPGEARFAQLGPKGTCCTIASPTKEFEAHVMLAKVREVALARSERGGGADLRHPTLRHARGRGRPGQERHDDPAQRTGRRRGCRRGDREVGVAGGVPPRGVSVESSTGATARTTQIQTKIRCIGDWRAAPDSHSQAAAPRTARPLYLLSHRLREGDAARGEDGPGDRRAPGRRTRREGGGGGRGRGRGGGGTKTKTRRPRTFSFSPAMDEPCFIKPPPEGAALPRLVCYDLDDTVWFPELYMMCGAPWSKDELGRVRTPAGRS